MDRQLNCQPDQPHALAVDARERRDCQDNHFDTVEIVTELVGTKKELLQEHRQRPSLSHANREAHAQEKELWGPMQDQQPHVDDFDDCKGQGSGSTYAKGTYQSMVQRNLPSTFYELLAKEADRNDKMAMLSALLEIKDVIKVFWSAIEEAWNDTESSHEATKVAGLARLTGLVECFQKFNKEWLWPFTKKLEGNLSCVANYSDADIDEQRSRDLENKWLPSLRSTLLKHQVKIPRCLCAFPEHDAILSFGILFYSDYFSSDKFWTAKPFGIEEGVGDLDNKEWPDECLMKAFLTSEEPFAALQAYKEKNVLLHCLPEKFGGTNLTNDNQDRLEKMKSWLEAWSGLDECDVKAEVIYRFPRKKKYEESTYKLNSSTYYMKCPGCNYIVLFPKPKGMKVGISERVMQSIKRADGSKKSVWESGKNGAHKLDIYNVAFDSPFKCMHPYKAMQGHIRNCQGCKNKVVPCCFGKTRRKRKGKDRQETPP